MVKGNDNSDALETAKTLLSENAAKGDSSDPDTLKEPARLTVPGVSSTDIPGAGVVLQDRYELEKELGRGGIGAVFLARDRKLHNRLVVIKVLLNDMGEDAWIYKKFLQEVEALTRIEHPNIVGVLDSGNLPDGKPFIVMQYVDGTMLRSQLKPEGMSLERVCTLVQQTGRALGVAHSKGILHRDLKPENIMLQTLGDGEEQVKIIDFGIARVHGSQIAPTTGTSTRAGTIAYMSPEQLVGQPLGVTSDVYALGIIAYEMITGRRPFNPDSVFQLHEMQRGGIRVKPKDLRPALPEAAQDVLVRALAYAPEERYQSAREFCDELAETLKSSFDVSYQSKARARLTKEQGAAAPTVYPSGPAAAAIADAKPVASRASRPLWTKPKVLVPAALAVLLALVGVLLYRRLNERSTAVQPAKLTTTEFTDEFLNMAMWTAPTSGWNINTREARLEIENQPQVGFATGVNYDNFEFHFHLKLLNEAGAAWALRIVDPGKYYLFYLSGPDGIYKNRFITYVVQDGKVNPSIFNLSTPVIVELKNGGQYQIDVKIEGNTISHTITPAETGEEVNLGLFTDPNNTYTSGGFGFRTVGIEKFSVDDLFARPLGTKLPQ